MVLLRWRKCRLFILKKGLEKEKGGGLVKIRGGRVFFFVIFGCLDYCVFGGLFLLDYE